MAKRQRLPAPAAISATRLATARPRVSSATARACPGRSSTASTFTCAGAARARARAGQARRNLGAHPRPRRESARIAAAAPGQAKRAPERRRARAALPHRARSALVAARFMRQARPVGALASPAAARGAARSWISRARKIVRTEHIQEALQYRGARRAVS